jgi:S-formylglutathione hydrolase FrmB
VKGRVAVESLDAPALAGNPLGDPTTRPVVVYYPPGYDSGKGRYPAVYFLHGFTGSGLGWLNVSAFTPRVPERLDALIEAGEVPPILGLFVDGWTAVGGSQWINSAAIGRYGDYLVQDVVGWADRTLRTRADPGARALVGKSSGGYGALATAARCPGVFGHVACHSGDAYFEYCYLPEFPKAASAFLAAGGVEPWWAGMLKRAKETKLKGEDHAVFNVVAMSAAYSPDATEPVGVRLPFEPDTARLRTDVWSRWLSQDPVRFVPENRAAFAGLKTLFVDCGTRDEFALRWGARMVVKGLLDAGVPVVHEEFEDGHMGINYRYDASLRRIGSAFPPSGGK